MGGFIFFKRIEGVTNSGLANQLQGNPAKEGREIDLKQTCLTGMAQMSVSILPLDDLSRFSSRSSVGADGRYKRLIDHVVLGIVTLRVIS